MLDFLEGDSDVFAADFGDFVVSVVLIVFDFIGEDFGFDELFVSFRGIAGKRELDAIVHLEAGVFAGRLDGADEIAGPALF